MATEDVQAIYALAGLRPGGPRGIENANFENVEFERLVIGPGKPPTSIVRVMNCSFSDCSVAGPFMVAAGAELENVVFDNVSSPDLMTIDTQTVLKNVVVKGSSKLRGLWVKPSAFADAELKRLCVEWSSTASESISCMLDFSEFCGKETEVVGLPLSKLRWNRERHVPVLLEWKASAEWKRLDLPLTSYWSMSMKRLQMFGATEGIFSLPSPKDKNYVRTTEEMNRLIQVGLLRSS